MSFSLRTNVLVRVGISQPGETFQAAKARPPYRSPYYGLLGVSRR